MTHKAPPGGEPCALKRLHLYRVISSYFGFWEPAVWNSFDGIPAVAGTPSAVTLRRARAEAGPGRLGSMGVPGAVTAVAVQAAPGVARVEIAALWDASVVVTDLSPVVPPGSTAVFPGLGGASRRSPYVAATGRSCHAGTHFRPGPRRRCCFPPLWYLIHGGWAGCPDSRCGLR